MSATHYLLDRETIEHCIDSVSLDRGVRYARGGNVLAAHLDTARAMATGRVRGSRGRAYQCIVQVAIRPNGEPELVGQCSCPVGYNCKHVAAVLLVLSEREAKAGGAKSAGTNSSGPAVSETQLPMELRGWLSRVERLANTTAAATEARDHLLYLVDRHTSYGISSTLLSAVKVRRLVEGGWGKPQEFNILGQSTASFVTREDQRILALVQSRHQTGSAGYGNGYRQARLDEHTGADVMHAIVGSGRAYYQRPDACVLNNAGPLAAQLLWRLGEDGQLHVELEADRPGLLLLPMTPPWYLDPETGDCGPLQTGLGDQEAGLLAMAPPVPVAAADALQETFQARIKQLRLPLPERPQRRAMEAKPPTPCLFLHSIDLAKQDSTRYWTMRREPAWIHAAVLRFDYGGIVVNPRDRAQDLQRIEDGVLLEGKRDMSAEGAAVEVLKGLGFRQRLDLNDFPGLCFEQVDDGAWLRFMGERLPHLRADGWRIEIDADFRFHVAPIGDWDVDIEAAEGGRWLDLGLGIDVDGTRMDLLPLLVSLIKQQPGELSRRAGAAGRSGHAARAPGGRPSDPDARRSASAPSWRPWWNSTTRNDRCPRTAGCGCRWSRRASWRSWRRRTRP